MLASTPINSEAGDETAALQARRARVDPPHVRRVRVRREQGDEVGVNVDANTVDARSEVFWLMRRMREGWMSRCERARADR
jgi:hypothetical protein